MIGKTNSYGEPRVLIDSHTLFYINGKSMADQSIYNATCQMRHNNNVYLANVPGPFNNQPCPVLFFRNGRMGWYNTDSRVAKTLSQVDGWTWEFWRWRISTDSSEDCFGVGDYFNSSANALHCDSSSNSYAYLYRNGGNYSSSSAGAFSSLQWYHVCYVNVNSVLTLYLNGVSKATWSNYGNTNATTGVIFGGYRADTLSGDGTITSFIAEARLSDIPRYTENFTPPTKFLY